MGLNVEIMVFIEYDIRFGKKFQTLRDVSFDAKSRLQIAIRIDVRISRIEQIGTDFFYFFCLDFEQEFQKNPYQSVQSVKSVHPFVSQCIQKCNLKMKHPNFVGKLLSIMYLKKLKQQYQ
jgi:hypothetical protein